MRSSQHLLGSARLGAVRELFLRTITRFILVPNSECNYAAPVTLEEVFPALFELPGITLYELLVACCLEILSNGIGGVEDGGIVG